MATPWIFGYPEPEEAPPMPQPGPRLIVRRMSVFGQDRVLVQHTYVHDVSDRAFPRCDAASL